MPTRTHSVEQAVSNQWDWFSTVRQLKGFGGPTVHYWGNSLSYIGPATDWRLEGIIAGLLELHAQLDDASYLESAIECGEMAVANQLENGSFENSAFEVNPSMGHIAQPHESAVDLALLQLAQVLQEQNDFRSEKFIHAAKRNIDEILLKRFWNDSARTFQQYAKGHFDSAPNLFVPNKIATACEALVLLSKLTGEKSYAQKAIESSEMILSMQSTETKTRGGIFQSNNREQIITFYTARCLRPLMALHQYTRDARYLRAANAAAKFIQAQQLENGLFSFGFHLNEEKKFPLFVAGSGDIAHALKSVKGFQAEIKKTTAYLLSQQQPTGGFPSFVGLNSLSDAAQERSWMDCISVAGWNDKAFRLLAGMVKKSLPAPSNQDSFQIQCLDGLLQETRTAWKITHTRTQTFGKRELFSNGDIFGIKGLTYALASSSVPAFPTIFKPVARLVGAR